MIIACVYAVLIFAATPTYVVNRMGMKFVSSRNRTIFGIVYNADRENVERVSYIINNFFLPFVAFVVIIISTVVLVISLKRRSKWLETATTSTKAGRANRGHKVAKMVVMISTLFIICFLPSTILLFTVAFEPSITVGGKYVNIGIIVFGISILLESVNSSVNIFIYYCMSTKYRETFRAIFCRF